MEIPTESVLKIADIDITGGCTIWDITIEHGSSTVAAGQEDEYSFTLWPDVYANVADLLGYETATTIVMTITGVAPSFDPVTAPSKHIACAVDVVYSASNALEQQLAEVVTLTVDAYANVLDGANIPLGSLAGTEDGNLQWNGHGDVVATPSPGLGTTLLLTGPGDSLNITVSATATYQDLQNEAHDDDYMTLTLPGKGTVVVTDDKVDYTSLAIRLHNGGTAQHICIVGTVWEDDTWQDDSLATAQLCVWIRYEKIPISSYLGFLPGTPRSCQDLVVALIDGNGITQDLHELCERDDRLEQLGRLGDDDGIHDAGKMLRLLSRRPHDPIPLDVEIYDGDKWQDSSFIVPRHVASS